MKTFKKVFKRNLLRNVLVYVLICPLLTSCYTTNTYSYSLEPRYNSTYRGYSKMQIINSLGSPSRISSVGDGVEIIVYENFNSMTLGTGNATAYGNGSYANAYGNSYSYRVNNRNYVEFYIKNGSCYQVKTNAKGWEKRREKYKMDDDLRNGLLIGGGTCVVTLLLLLLAGNK